MRNVLLQHVSASGCVKVAADCIGSALSEVSRETLSCIDTVGSMRMTDGSVKRVVGRAGSASSGVFGAAPSVFIV